MKINIKTVDSKQYSIDKPVQIAFIRTAGAACDALSVRFKSDAFISEIVNVTAYNGDKLIFNGYCDNQRITQNDDGIEVYFYARSSACLLVDSQAQPFTYNRPTAKQLCLCFADKFGFECCLPEIHSKDKYEVAKGVSCYGAINNFVSLITGSNVYVTPDNRLKLLSQSVNVKSLNDYKIVSASAITNRSEPISEISYKREASSGYILHTSSCLSKELGISREQFVNLTSLPQWQRDYTVLKRLKDSFGDYKVLELTVSGYVEDELYQRFNYISAGGKYEDYVLTEKKYTFDKNGRFTRLTLKKILDIKEITYVD
ncbi:MAG: hypothetical protein ACI4IQ_07050 [Eubacterium sp.]